MRKSLESFSLPYIFIHTHTHIYIYMQAYIRKYEQLHLLCIHLSLFLFSHFKQKSFYNLLNINDPSQVGWDTETKGRLGDHTSLLFLVSPAIMKASSRKIPCVCAAKELGIPLSAFACLPRISSSTSVTCLSSTKLATSTFAV